MAQASRHQDDAGAVALATLVALWRWRLELAITLVLVVVALAFIDEPLPIQLFAVSCVAAIAWFTKPLTLPALHRADVRRRWAHACERSGLVAPRIKTWGGIHPIPAGDRLRIRITAKSPLKSLHNLSDAIASEYGRDVEVRVIAHPETKRWATVVIMRSDPFQGSPSMPWPNRDAERLSVWSPVPFGVDEEGREVEVRFTAGHVLIGGVTRSGKSNALAMFVATSACDPNDHLFAFDNKEVELAPWAGCAEAFVGPDIGEGIKQLQGIQTVLQQRMVDLKSGRRREVGPGDPTYAVVIDELAYYLLHPDKKKREAFRGLLLDILQRGLAAGIRVIAATQRPSADILDTNLRAQFGYRIGFRTLERETTRMIFGEGEKTCPAHLIPEEGYQGVCFLGTESTRGRRTKAYRLTDDDIEAIATRASGASVDAELLAAQLVEEETRPVVPERYWGIPMQDVISPDDWLEGIDLSQTYSDAPPVSRETFDGSPTQNHRMRPRDHDGDVRNAIALLDAHPEGIRREAFYVGDDKHPGVPFTVIDQLWKEGAVTRWVVCLSEKHQGGCPVVADPSLDARRNHPYVFTLPQHQPPQPSRRAAG